MTRSSKSRRSRARAKKWATKNLNRVNASASSNQESALPTFSKTDKRYMIAFAILSLLITIGYWWLGGRNLFVFPALFCISVGVRKYWAGPVRQYANTP